MLIETRIHTQIMSARPNGFGWLTRCEMAGILDRSEQSITNYTTDSETPVLGKIRGVKIHGRWLYDREMAWEDVRAMRWPVKREAFGLEPLVFAKSA